MNQPETILNKLNKAMTFLEENKPGYPMVVKFRQGEYILTVDISADGYDDSCLLRLDELGYDEYILCSVKELNDNNIDLRALIHEYEYSNPVEMW